MKKKILLGLFSVLFLLPIGVSAETLSSINPENNSSDASVTVGEVEVPVYSVEIDWNSFKFDWKYNRQTNKYEWQVGSNVSLIPLDEYFTNFNKDDFIENQFKICHDSSCPNVIGDGVTYEMILSDIEHYYIKSVGDNTNHFHIGDYSTGGEIVPSVKWTSEVDYSYVDGIFKYEKLVERCELIEDEELFDEIIGLHFGMFTDSSCTDFVGSSVTEYADGYYFLSSGTEFVELETQKIPDDGRLPLNQPNANWYHLTLDLKNKTQPTETPKAGDKIGTITITIEAAE